MKKICVFILLLTMLLVNNVYAFDFGFTNNVVKVSYIDDVIRTDKTLNTDIIDNYSNQVNKYNVAVNTNQNNELLISGNVNNKNFNITAIPKLINQNENAIYFGDTTNNDNYKVINISLEKEIENSFVYHKSYVENKKCNNVLKIYLQPKGTNDILVIELFNNNLQYYFNEDLDIAHEADENADLSLKFWYASLFKGKMEEECSISMSCYDSEKTYSYTYNIGGNKYIHKLELNRQVTMPYTVTGSGAPFITKIKIVSNKVYSEYGNEMSDYSSCLSVRNPKISIAIEEGDAIISSQTDGQFNKPSKFSLNFKFNRIPIKKIGTIGCTYTKAKEGVDLNETFSSYDNNSYECVKEHSVEFAKTAYLKNNGDFFSIDWLIANFNNLNNNKQLFKTRFDYFIYNGLDLYDDDCGLFDYTTSLAYFSQMK